MQIFPHQRTICSGLISLYSKCAFVIDWFIESSQFVCWICLEFQLFLGNHPFESAKIYFNIFRMNLQAKMGENKNKNHGSVEHFPFYIKEFLISLNEWKKCSNKCKCNLRKCSMWWRLNRPYHEIFRLLVCMKYSELVNPFRTTIYVNLNTFNKFTGIPRLTVRLWWNIIGQNQVAEAIRMDQKVILLIQWFIQLKDD